MASRPHSERQELQDAISALVERAPQMDGEDFAVAALQPLMAANNMISDLEEQLQAGQSSVSTTEEDTMPESSEAWELVKTIRKGLDISDPDSFTVRTEALNNLMVLFSLVQRLEEQLEALRERLEQTGRWATDVLDSLNVDDDDPDFAVEVARLKAIQVNASFPAREPDVLAEAIDDSVFRSDRWTSEVVVDQNIEYRRDYRDGVLVQILLRPVGHRQWQKPMDLLCTKSVPASSEPKP